LGLINNDEEVRYNWLNPDTGDETNIKVGCMSDMLDTSPLFRNRKKGASIDIETLKRIIEQDAPTVYGAGVFGGDATTPQKDGIKFCAVGYESYADLQKIVSLKKLPDTVCVDNNGLATSVQNQTPMVTSSATNTASSNMFKSQSQINCESAGGNWLGTGCLCPTGQAWVNNKCVINGTNLTAGAILGGGTSSVTQFNNTTQQIQNMNNSLRMTFCRQYGGKWDIEKQSCNCVGTSEFLKCMDATK
jgi:hypothetical protein